MMSILTLTVMVLLVATMRRRPAGGARGQRAAKTGTGPVRLDTVKATPRARRAPSARTQAGSTDAVMTTAVIPRLSRPIVTTRVSIRGDVPSASTAARSCMILRC